MSYHHMNTNIVESQKIFGFSFTSRAACLDEDTTRAPSVVIIAPPRHSSYAKKTIRFLDCHFILVVPILFLSIAGGKSRKACIVTVPLHCRLDFGWSGKVWKTPSTVL